MVVEEEMKAAKVVRLTKKKVIPKKAMIISRVRTTQKIFCN